MPQWRGSTRRDTLPPDWPTTHARILNRDRHACQHVRNDTGRPCGREAHHVDHITGHASGGSDADDNLQALCEYHHNVKSGREGGLASQRARRARTAANTPTHPGLIDMPTPPVIATRNDPAPF